MGLPRFQHEPAPSGRPETRFPYRPRPDFTKALFILTMIGVLYVARTFFMPLVLGLLFALVLLPPVHILARRRIPPALGAAIVLLLFVGALGTTAYLLASPISLWARKAPEVAAKLALKFERIVRPLHELKAKVTQPPPPPAGEPPPPAITIHQQAGFLSTAVSRAGASLAMAATTFILLYFLLASGDALFRSALSQISDVRQKAQLVAIGQQVRHQVSKYLLAITAINIAEGALIAGGLALTGMPTPLLWGAMHAVLNFIPYIGSITGLAVTAVVALISFPSIPHALIAPGIYLGVMVLDNFTSPMVLGNRLVLNPALVFVSLMFWGWLWGLVGVLVAIPILMVIKIICDSLGPLHPYGRIISGNTPPETAEPEPLI
jgi:predicted PurR-regulated permease PerM